MRQESAPPTEWTYHLSWHAHEDGGAVQLWAVHPMLGKLRYVEVAAPTLVPTPSLTEVIDALYYGLLGCMEATTDRG